MVDVGDLHIFGTNGGVTKCNIYVYIIMHTYVYIYIYIYERGMDFVAAHLHLLEFCHRIGGHGNVGAANLRHILADV